jgi:3-phenylpropionate/trans-cinnamate dioxygenase ferredoxin reductase subunit
MSAFVIVGAGLAGAKAAEALREQGYDGDLVLIGDEQLPPYERPPLSKGYLAGSDAFDDAVVHPEDWYAEHGIDLRLGTRVTALRPSDHVVELDGTDLRYDRLLLATGSTPRHLPGDDELLHLRRRGDSDAIRERFGQGRMVIVGGGWIGLEVAAAARGRGASVTVIEIDTLPLRAAVGDDVAAVFARLHRDNGVDLRLSTGISEIRANSVLLDDGTEIPADLILAGVGVRPATELAESGGLAVDGGILVDAALRTSDPDVYAAGDVARIDHPWLHDRVHVEHWANALNGGPAAARSMLGQDVSYEEIPFFFSDQYDLGIEYAGWGSYDQVVFRGDPAAGYEFVAFYLREGKLVAGLNANVWDVQDPIQAIIRSGKAVDAAQLADPSVSLESLA